MITLDDLIVGVTLALTVGGLLALAQKRWLVGTVCCLLAIACFWGYYVGVHNE